MTPDFIKTIQEHFEKIPAAPAVTDERGHVLSYHDLDALSARVYAYLRSAGVQKGQFVMVYLPRSAYIPAVMLGAIRAGAAFVVLESDIPAERMEYIRADCGCVLTLDATCWDEVLRTQPLFAWAKAGEHDVLTAAYTSGTTGSPKGVILERGILDLNCLASSVVGETGAFRHGDGIAIGFPLNYIVFTVCFGFLFMGGTLQILDVQTSRDAQRYLSYLRRFKPETVFLIPSLYKMIAHALPSSVRTVFLGGELSYDLPANDDRCAISIYSATETGYVCAYCFADGRSGKLPLGSQLLPDGLLLLKPDGKYAAPGEYGEIYARVPYTRGYIGLPEETAEHFHGGYFRTGDVGRIDGSGDLICCGRSDEMIKIGGNRMEPEEIASAFSQAAGGAKACVKACSAGAGSSLCLYYTGPELKEPEAVLNAMAKKLPEYMLPSFFVRLESFPCNKNGKIDRNALPDPDRTAEMKLYLPPADETEDRLCRAFARVFGLSRVGVLDDFLSLGGTSLMATELAMEVEGAELSVPELYECGSIRELAARLRDKNTDNTPESAETHSCALFPAQEYYLRWQAKLPASTMYNLPLMLRFDPQRYEAEGLRVAVEKAIKAHPALLTSIHADGGQYRQTVSPALFRPVVSEKLSEEELEVRLGSLVVPFDPLGEPLYRSRLFETEAGIYLFLDVFHAVFDGASFRLFIDDLLSACRGLPLKRKDCYLRYPAYRERLTKTEHYGRSLQYFSETYVPEGRSVFPKKDGSGAKKIPGSLSVPLDVLADRIETFKAARGTTSNGFFLLVSLFTLSVFNLDPKVFLHWLYNGRTEREWMGTAGLFNIELPIALEFSEDSMLSRLLSSANGQIAAGIACSDCDWGNLNPTETVTFIYQKDIILTDFYENDGISLCELPNPLKAAENDFDIVVYDDAGGLSLSLEYDASEYREESIRHFGELFCAAARYFVSAEDWEHLTVKDAVEALRDLASPDKT